jgi:short-subunit dehydrogenase
MENSTNNKTIVITGSSTGIGKACALHLDKLGYNIYAGVRKQTDGDRLREEASDRLVPIILDVTDADSITAAVSTIEREAGGNVFGLINNAGIGRSGVLEVTPIDEIRKVMDVMIPMLRKNKGRIINIGSTASFLASPGASAYAASKFAVRAVTDSLRLELQPFGMSVILVAPGAVESEIWEKGTAYKNEMRRSIKPENAQRYATLIKFGENLIKEIKKIPAKEVAISVAQALASKKPKPYYIVGKDAKAGVKAARLPKSLLDWIFIKRIQKLGK